MSLEEIEIPEEAIQRRSAADFFHDNKAIAGFDNSLRVVFTSVRELVENGLDAAEKVQHLPELFVKVEILKSEEIEKLLEVKKYQKEERLDFIKLTVRDNGMGVQENAVPDLFGRVLTGSNYGARQSRGRFGLGAKMVLLNAMATVDLPIVVTSRYFKENKTSRHELFIDLQKNEPIIKNKEIFTGSDQNNYKKSGTEVIVTFTGSWTLAKRYIKDYIHQLAIITPYAEFSIELPDDETIFLERVVDEMPAYPETTKIHPWGCDITQLKREVNFTNKTNMVDFLVNHFESITPKKAREFLAFVNIKENLDPKKLSSPDIRRIVHDGFQLSAGSKKKKKKDQIAKFVFNRPSGTGLSPLGEDKLKRGLVRELSPEIAESITRPVNAYGGHPFIIEAAIAYGGKQLEDESPGDTSSKDSKNARIYRFANRIPLLFGAGNDIANKVIFDDKNLSWKDYKININNAPIAIAVSLVSTKIPFPETSKEYIADVQEIREELVQALKTLGSRVRTYLSRKERTSREKQRRSRFELYAPRVSKALSEILHNMPGEILPFDLSNIENLMSRALVEATPKSFRRYKPPSPPIYTLRSWSDLEGNIRRNLDDIGVVTACDFLYTEDEILAGTKIINEDRIREIKHISVARQDSDPSTPKISELNLIPNWIEKGFPDYEKAEKALAKRWISTIWDFFATGNEGFLSAVGLLEKIVYLEKYNLIQLSKKKGLLNDSHQQMSSLPWVTSDIESELKSKGISTKVEFLIKFNNELYHKSNLPEFHKYLISYIKADIRKDKKLDENITAVGVDWLTGDSKKLLNSKLKLKSWQDLIDEIDAHPKNVIELDLLLDSIINELKESIRNEILEDNKYHIGLGTLIEDNPEYLDILEKKRIRSIFEFISIEPEKLDKNLKIFFIKKFRKQNLDEYNTKNPVYLEKLVWIPPTLEEKLTDSHILTVYDFLISPTETIKSVVGDLMDVEFIREIKIQWGIPLNYLDSDLRAKFHENNFLITEEIMHLEKKEVLKSKAKDLWKDIELIQNTLNSPIVAFPNFPPKSFANVIQHGIVTIYDFLIWPEGEYNKLKMELVELLTLKQHINLEQINDSLKTLSISMDNIKIIPKGEKEVLKQYGILTAENILFLKDYQLIPEGITEKDKNALQNAINNVRHLLNSPVVYLPYIDPISVRKFLLTGIRRVSDLLYWPLDELETLLPDISNLDSTRKTIETFSLGRLLKDTRLLSSSIVRHLASANIKTIEDIYFRLHPSNFAVEGVDWSDIRAVRQVLDLPVGLIVFDSSKKQQKLSSKKESSSENLNETDEEEEKTSTLYEPISPELVVRLKMQGINTILEFMIIPPEQLADLIGESFENILDFQSRVKIKSEEEKFPIEDDLMGIDKKLRKELESVEITTIEDLYFISSEIFEENPELTSTIQKLRNGLDIPLTVLEDFTPKMTSILEKRQILTLIHFLMYPDDKLAELLNVSIERFEEGIKRPINLVEISNTVAYPISAVKGLSQKQQLFLKQNNVHLIADLLKLKTTQNTLLKKEPSIDKLLSDISLNKIQELVEESQQVMNQILGKRLGQKLQEKGVTTLEEILMLTDEQRDELSSDDELWNRIKLIRDQLKLPANYIVSSRFRATVQTCTLHDIVTVLDFLAVSNEEVENLGISNNEIMGIRKSLQLENLLPYFSVPIETFAIFRPYIDLLHSGDIATIGDFLHCPPKKVSSLLAQKDFNEKEFYHNFSFWDIVESLNIPITYVMDLDQNIVINLIRRKIVTLMDWWKTPKDSLGTYLSVDEYEVESIWNNIDWGKIWFTLSLPVSIDDNIPGPWKQNSQDVPLLTIGSILILENKEIQTIFATPERNIKQWKSKINYKDILNQFETNPRKQFLVAFNELDKLEKETSKKVNLFEKTINGKKYNLSEYKVRWEIPVQSLADISVNIKTNLIQAKIGTIKELYLFSEQDLGKYASLSDNEIKTLLEKTFIPNITLSEQALQPIEKFTFISDSTLSRLQKFGFKNISDLKKYKDAPEEIQREVQTLYRISKAPIQFLPDIKGNEIDELLTKDKFTIEHLFLTTDDNEYSSIKEKASSTKDIEQNRLGSGLSTDLFNAVPKSLKESLEEQLGYNDFCLEEIAFNNITPNPEISLNKPDAISLERFITVFFSPIQNLTIIYEEDPSLIEKLISEDIKYVFQLLRFKLDQKSLSERLNIQLTTVRNLFNNIDFSKIAISIKKDSVDLSPQNTLIQLTDQDIQNLISMRITSVQDLFNPPIYIIKFNDLEEINKLIKNKSKINPEEISIARVKGVPLSDINKLRNLGIKTLKDFIFVPGSVIRQKTKIKAGTISDIKLNPVVMQKEVIQTKIDKLFKSDVQESLKIKKKEITSSSKKNEIPKTSSKRSTEKKNSKTTSERRK